MSEQERPAVMSLDDAWDLLGKYYPGITIDEDPEWATEMVDALMHGELTLP